MRTMLGRTSITSLLVGIFGVLITLSAIMGLGSWRALSENRDQIIRTNAEAQDLMFVGDISTALAQAQLAVKDFAIQGTPETQILVENAIEAAVNIQSEAVATLREGSATAQTLAEITPLLEEYQFAFAEAALAQITSNRAVNDTLLPEGTKIRQQLSELLRLAQEQGDTDSAYRTALAQEQLLLGRIYMQRFIVSRDPSDVVKSLEYVQGTMDAMSTLMTSLQDRSQRSVAGQITLSLIGYKEAAEIAQNNILERDSHLFVLAETGPQILKLARELDQKLNGDQAALAPILAAEADFAAQSSLVLAIGSLVVCGAAAVVLLLAVRSPIVTITRSMNLLAEGDTNITLPCPGWRNELGRMSSALDVFRRNAIAKTEMEEAAKVQAQKVEQDRKAMMADLQDAFGTVVAAANEGDFSARVHQQFNDTTLTTLKTGMNSLMETVDSGLESIASTVRSLANADFTARAHGQFRGAFAALQGDVNSMAEELSRLLGDIKAAATSVDTAAVEMTAGADDLARRTTQQASNLEETAAAVEQILASVRENAQRSSAADQSVTQVMGVARDGGDVMAKARSAMEAITQSSTKISEIIGMIDGIAFQTNLLALNASVEAARAGEAGKGFTVVASEVRRLAQSAAEASQQVKTLIEASVTEVGAGSTLVEQAAGSLTRILEAVTGVGEQVSGVARASETQTQAITEINQAVRALDDMTQRNAALVEENNAALASTRQQTTALDDMISRFKVA